MYLKSIILVTPEDFLESDISWWEKEIKNQFFREFFGSAAQRWGYSKIFNLMLKHPHVGSEYYPEIKLVESSILKLAIAKVNDKYLGDFSFINDSNITFLLTSIELVVHQIHYGLGGIGEPPVHYLTPNLDLEFPVDLKKEQNIFTPIHPIIFKVKEQMRLKIQFKGISETKPGIGVEYFIRFYFNDNFYLESPIFNS